LHEKSALRPSGLAPHAVLLTAHAIGVLAKMPLRANIFASLLNDYMRSPLCGLRGLHPRAVLHTAHAIGVLAKMPLRANIFASLLNAAAGSPLYG